MPHPLLSVRSGGQTGVDIAALRAARACGISTAGWMPKGWQTLDGPKPGYAVQFGMRESRGGYPVRTLQNVTDAHATLRLATHWSSPGEVCTMGAISQTGRPYLDVTLIAGTQSVSRVVDWLRKLTLDGKAPIALNVAGNSEQTSPGIEAAAETFLRRLFVELAASDASALPRDGLLARLATGEAA